MVSFLCTGTVHKMVVQSWKWPLLHFLVVDSVILLCTVIYVPWGVGV